MTKRHGTQRPPSVMQWGRARRKLPEEVAIVTEGETEAQRAASPLGTTVMAPGLSSQTRFRPRGLCCGGGGCGVGLGLRAGQDQPGPQRILQRLWAAEGAQGWGRPPHAPQGRVTADPPTVLITTVVPGFQKAGPPADPITVFPCLFAAVSRLVRWSN